MVNLTVTLSGGTGSDLTVTEVYSLTIQKKYEKPADSFSLVVESYLQDNEYTNIKITYRFRTLFDGIIDSFEQVFGEKGSYTKIEGRSKIALLLDREAKPAVFFTASLQQIISTYVHPHPFSTDLILSTSLTDFVVSKGVSCWDAVELFCIHAYGKPPRLINWNIITTSYDNSPNTFEINTGTTSAYPFSSVSKKRDFSNLVTRVYVKNEISYTGTHNNPQYPNTLTKERYLDPNMRWYGRSESQANYIMEQSNLRDKVITLTFPGLTQVEIGALIYFTYAPYFPRKRYKIIEVKEEIVANKVETTVFAREDS